MERRTALYRHYNDSDELLYVGISVSLQNRIKEHELGSCWFTHVSKITVEWYGSLKIARQMEKLAILEEAPLYNVADAPEEKAVKAMKRIARMTCNDVNAEDALKMLQDKYDDNWLSKISCIDIWLVKEWKAIPKTHLFKFKPYIEELLNEKKCE